MCGGGGGQVKLSEPVTMMSTSTKDKTKIPEGV